MPNSQRGKKQSDEIIESTLTQFWRPVVFTNSAYKMCGSNFFFFLSLSHSVLITCTTQQQCDIASIARVQYALFSNKM
jgi:hypothetical protein